MSLVNPAVPMAAAAPRAGVVARVLAVVAGIALFFIGGTVTLGLALAAPVGMLIAWAVARARRRPLTRLASWIAAMLTAAVVVGAAGAYMATKAPAGTFAEMQHAKDSARVARADQPMPAWVERIAPGTAAAQRNSATTPFARSRAVMYWGAAMGVIFTCALFGAIAGTLGWGATALVAYGARGRWLPSHAVTASVPDEPDLA